MKQNKGITLIALVVTIIVLLILAGVAIAMLRGDNGILNRASEAKYNNIIGSFDEQIKLQHMAVRTTISTKMVSTEGYIATAKETVGSGATATEKATNLIALATDVATALGTTAVEGKSGNSGIATDAYTVAYYLDDVGTATNNGDGYIVIWYTDNSLRSSMKDSDRANIVSANKMVDMIDSGDSDYNINQFTLAQVIHVTNYNCTVSKKLVTSINDADSDIKQTAFLSTSIGAKLVDASEDNKTAGRYDLSMVLMGN